VSEVLWREPIEFVAGDTLAFNRRLADYPADQGWSLLYELRGGTQAVSFTSTASGSDHACVVSAATTSTWAPGSYVLEGYAVNGDQRFTIYYGALAIRLNLQTAPGNAPIQTFAQQMLAQIEQTMRAKAGDDLAASQLGDTRFQYLTPEQLRIEHGYWKGVRRQEIAKERAKAGLPTGNKIRTTINVVNSGTGYGVMPYQTFPF